MRQVVYYTKLQSLLESKSTVTINVYKYTILRNTYKNNTRVSLKIRHSKYG